jgi:hypothetical protein
METRLSGVKSDQNRHDIFIAMEGGNQAVRVGWLAVVMRIQYFSFGYRGEVMGRSTIRK